MNGKDLFAGLSFIDERYIDEAESCGLPSPVVSLWFRAAAMAACLCLVMLSLWCLQPFQTDPHGLPTETTWPIMPEGFPTVMVYVEEMTDEGLKGTVADQMIPELFTIGMELNVVITEDTMHEAGDYTGCHVLVEFVRYDLDTAVVFADCIQEIPPPEHAN